MEKRKFKNNIYSSIAGMAKAFSNANRLEIIDLIANGEKSVEQIALQTAISVANASQHLQILKRTGLVKIRRDGNFIYYSLNGNHAYSAWKAMRDLAINQDPVIQVTMQNFRFSFGSQQGIHYNNVPVEMEVIYLDVRPADEFLSGHIKNACSIPIEELPERLMELPRHKLIVAYCRGPFCTYADEAVMLLQANGFDAVRLEESYLDVTTGEVPAQG